jgi:hypothetical protein
MITFFELIDPGQLEPTTQLLYKFDNPVFKGRQDIFFRQQDHVIIYSQKMFTWKDTGKAELFADQIEIPARAIQWIVETIEIKFFNRPDKGGLPDGVFHHCETIKGEKLCINRTANSGGEGIGGYRLVNMNRKSHISDTSKQEFAMPDPFLFEHGLMDYLKDLAGKIQRREV